MQLVLFNPYIGLYQVLPRRARLDLGSMAMKGCSAFPKAPASLETHHQIVYCHIQDTYWWVSYPSAEVQSVYFTAPNFVLRNITIGQYHIYPTPPLGQDMTQGQFLSGV